MSIDPPHLHCATFSTGWVTVYAHTSGLQKALCTVLGEGCRQQPLCFWPSAIWHRASRYARFTVLVQYDSRCKRIRNYEIDTGELCCMCTVGLAVAKCFVFEAYMQWILQPPSKLKHSCLSAEWLSDTQHIPSTLVPDDGVRVEQKNPEKNGFWKQVSFASRTNVLPYC